MLILTRRPREIIRIGDDIEIEVLSLCRKGVVRLGITAPKDISVHREEIYQQIQKTKERRNANIRIARSC